MLNESALVFSGIAPHPPIMVPEVGREAISDVRGSIEAMAELTKRIIRSGAETVVLISPHAPLDPHAFVAYKSRSLYGDFANFSAPKTVVEAPLDQELLESIAALAQAENLAVIRIEGSKLDHGTAVPLYFLQRNGWCGQVVALGYSYISNSDHLRFGECVRKAADASGRPVALIASGDLSHRLKPNAPAGYNPNAFVFDEEVVDAIQSNMPDRIVNIDPALRRLAGECGYRSMLIAIGATHHLPLTGEVLHYEAPFGVGYMVAQLTSQATTAKSNDSVETSEREPGDVLPKLAREAVETYVRKGENVSPALGASPILGAHAACFVSIKTINGELRGCIGTIEPAEDNLAEELVINAIGAATRDPRFHPVAPEELANLRYSVDVLSPHEPARFEDLDPHIYGVIVEDESGLRRGLLLPDIEGIETAQQQVEIAARKAGIPTGTPLRLSRFRVDRFREKPPEV